MSAPIAHIANRPSYNLPGKQINVDYARLYTYKGNPTAQSDRSVPSISSTVPSLTASHSSGELDIGHVCPSVDLAESINARLEKTVDPISLDKGLSRQAQTSGALRAKQQELASLQALAQQRLQRARGRIAAGLTEADSVRKDLEWSQKKISALKVVANDVHPAMYRKAVTRISPSISH